MKTRKQQRAEHAALRHTVADVLPAGAEVAVHGAHAAAGQEGAQPQPRPAAHACVVQAVEQDVVVDAVEGLLDVQEEDGAERVWFFSFLTRSRCCTLEMR